MRRLFEVNSEPHTGSRPSVRLCVGLMTAKIAEYFPISAKIYNIRAHILRQTKLNEYIIIDKKVGDDNLS